MQLQVAWQIKIVPNSLKMNLKIWKNGKTEKQKYVKTDNAMQLYMSLCASVCQEKMEKLKNEKAEKRKRKNG